jgi:hypothetical protein
LVQEVPVVVLGAPVETIPGMAERTGLRLSKPQGV